MCGVADSIEQTTWQQEPPDSSGEWLWIMQWSDCGCVMKSGIAWVPEIGEEPEEMVALPSGLSLSWEGQKCFKTMEIDHVTAWRKITLPPLEWCQERANNV